MRGALVADGIRDEMHSSSSSAGNVAREDSDDRRGATVRRKNYAAGDRKIASRGKLLLLDGVQAGSLALQSTQIEQARTANLGRTH
jgi:hypothetical protein